MIPHKVVPAQEQKRERAATIEGDSDAEGVSFYHRGYDEKKCGEESGREG
jgi:hypothetical protein